MALRSRTKTSPFHADAAIHFFKGLEMFGNGLQKNYIKMELKAELVVQSGVSMKGVHHFFRMVPLGGSTRAMAH